MQHGFAGPAFRPGGRPDVAVILPSLLVGEYPTAEDAGWLRTVHGVDAVVNLQDHGDLLAKNVRLTALERAYAEHGMLFHHVPIPDGDGDFLAARLDGLVLLLGQLIDGGKRVYVHCNGGFNRAPTVAIAYLCARDGRTVPDAQAFVNARRPCVPYAKQLEAYCPVPPTAAETAAHKAALDDQGYCLVEGALSPSRLATLRDTLVRVAADEIANGTDYVYEDGANQRVWVLLNKGRVFEELAQDALALELVGHLLGPGFLLSNTNANITGPGGKPMFLHSDTDYVPPPFPSYAMVTNVMWFIDDFTDENGAIRIVPGSHRLRHAPDYAKTYDTVPVTGPAGTAMVFHGGLWHQTGPNRTADQKRHGILTYYCRPFMRQQENFFKSLDDAVLARATPRLRQLLGYDLWLGGVGAIGGLPPNAQRF